jgi:hypothetical protein
MHSIDLPAGSSVRLTATARANAAEHRWDIRVLEATAPRRDPTSRIEFGSRIGSGDCEQRVDIPAQDVDCRLEVDARHAVEGGWKDDRCSVQDDTPSRLQLGFADRSLPYSKTDDILLSFVFQPATPSA